MKNYCAPQSVVRNGYSAGRWEIHYRDENSNRPLRFSQYPNLTMNASSTGDDLNADARIADARALAAEHG